MNVDQHRSGHERTRAQQIRRALWSGLRRRCPHCHRGPLFVKRYTLHERCPKCDYPITSALDDLVILTYIGSASITGLFGLTAFVIRPPKSGVELLAYVLLALGLLFGTLPHRKAWRSACSTCTTSSSATM